MDEAERKNEALIRAEAAAWLARIRSEEAEDSDRAGFEAWLAEDARHRDAFEHLTTAWDFAGGVKNAWLAGFYHPESRSAPSHLTRRAVLAGTVAAAAVGLWRYWPTPAQAVTFATAVGERRRVGLADGSVIMLDTASAARATMEGGRRTVDLLRGRAFFEVARDEARPFTVQAEGRQVTALGTAFDVAWTEETFSVLLVTGQVSVRHEGQRTSEAVVLSERGDYALFPPDNGPIRLERQDLSLATAWHDGRIVFENQTLTEAVRAMNRYTDRPIVIEDAGAGVGSLLVSGTYKTEETEAFAEALGTMFPISVTFEASRIVVAAAPGARYDPR